MAKKKDTTKDPRDLAEAVNERLRWATAAVNVFCCDIDSIYVEAFSGVEDHLRSAKKSAEKLSRWVYRNAPNRARDYKLGAHRSEADLELFNTMRALPEKCVMNAFQAWLAISGADEPIKTEALELIEKDGYVTRAQGFILLRKEGHIHAANGGAEEQPAQ